MRKTNQPILLSDRVCIFGKSGSGKTTLVRHLLQQYPRYVVLDGKRTYEDGSPIISKFDKRKPRQIIRVPSENETDNWRLVMRDIFKNDRKRVVYLDETTFLTPPRIIVPELGDLIRAGRELKLGVWCGSQRPRDIPSAVFTETNHFFIFRLSYEPDRDKVVSFTGDIVKPLIDKVRGHDTIYYNDNDEKAYYLHLKLRKVKNARRR